MTTVPCVIEIPDVAADPAEGRYVGFAGRFVPEKGVEVLLEAIRLCGLPLRLAGDAPTHPACGLFRPPRGVRHDAEQGAARRTPIRGARVLAVPSTWFETFGIVPAEAMSHGVPVVASRIGALQETVQDGVTGLLFEPGNPRDLAEKLRLLWDDAGACRRLGAAGRERIARLCHKDAHYRRLMSVYEDAIRDQRNS